MNKVRVSFDLSLNNDESTSRIFGWIFDAMQMNLERGESITNLVVEQSEDEPYDNGLREVSCDEDCC